MEKFDHLFIQPRDWGKSYHFYSEVLGWKTTYTHGEAHDAGRFAILQNNDFKLILAEDHDPTDPSKKSATYLTTGKISMHFNTEDVDQVFNKVPDGPHVVVKPENNHWGTRWFMLQDPDGNQFGWQGPKK